MPAPARLWVGLSATLRAFLRQPVTLALVVVLPPVVVTGYGSMMAAFPRLPGMSAAPGTVGAVNGALFVGAFLPGVVGLFQVISARRADERLTLCGFRRTALFGSRLLTVAVACLAVAGVTLAALATRTSVADPAWSYLALVCVGLTYGGVGALVGAVLPRELEGSLALVFVADVDEVLSSGLVRAEGGLTRLFPMHYTHDVFEATVTGAAVPAGDAAGAVGYLAVLLVAALAVYAAVAGPGGSRG